MGTNEDLEGKLATNSRRRYWPHRARDGSQSLGMGGEIDRESAAGMSGRKEQSHPVTQCISCGVQVGYGPKGSTVCYVLVRRPACSVTTTRMVPVPRSSRSYHCDATTAFSSLLLIQWCLKLPPRLPASLSYVANLEAASACLMKLRNFTSKN